MSSWLNLRRNWPYIPAGAAAGAVTVWLPSWVGFLVGVAILLAVSVVLDRVRQNGKHGHPR